MNKSIYTNLCALTLLLLSIILENSLLYSIAVFSLAGAITNWLAIHMLFEKVPGLYGSGVIPARFEEFKAAIKMMMMQQFFSTDNVEKFMHDNLKNGELDLQSVISEVDFAPTFDGLLEVIKASPFGAMLEMAGGAVALDPKRQPFVNKIQASLIETTQTKHFKQLIANKLQQSSSVSEIVNNVEKLIEQRLQELTPALVKQIVQAMIKQHLGWLVVWGGVFGGLIGALAFIWN
jgi:uncharacterized membrane protein YheB (UPF0754 family)